MALEQDRPMLKKQSFTTNFVLFLTLSAMAFFGVCNPQSSDLLSGDAASVDGDDITRYEFQREYEDQNNRLKQSQKGKNNPAESRVATQTLEKLVQDRIVFLEAKKAGFFVDQEFVVANLLEQKTFQDEKGIFKEEYFRRFLRYRQYTEESFFEEYRRDLTSSQFQNFLFDFVYFADDLVSLKAKMEQVKVDASFIKFASQDVDLNITPKDISVFLEKPGSQERVSAWYKNNIFTYQSKEQVKASHILIAYKGAQKSLAKIKRTKEQAKKEAWRVYKKVSKNNFAKLASSHSDDPVGKSKGGDLGFFDYTSMAPAFSKKAFALSVGKVSEPVETPFGFHIIKVQDKKVAQNISLEDARDDIVKTLIAQTKKLQLTKEKSENILLALNKGQNVKEALKKLNTTWQSTGEFSPLSYSIPKLGSAGDFLGALSSLKKAGDIYDQPLLHKKDYFILRLNKIVNSKVKEQVLDLLKNRLLWEEKYKISLSITSQLYSEYQAAKLIVINNDYLSLDNPAAVKQ
jgi:peptidyl-prolyl cis-trans isomerase D